MLAAGRRGARLPGWLPASIGTLKAEPSSFGVDCTAVGFWSVGFWRRFGRPGPAASSPGELRDRVLEVQGRSL